MESSIGSKNYRKKYKQKVKARVFERKHKAGTNLPNKDQEGV
jgi:hypothetical protein